MLFKLKEAFYNCFGKRRRAVVRAKNFQADFELLIAPGIPHFVASRMDEVLRYHKEFFVDIDGMVESRKLRGYLNILVNKISRLTLSKMPRFWNGHDYCHKLIIRYIKKIWVTLVNDKYFLNCFNGKIDKEGKVDDVPNFV